MEEQKSNIQCVVNPVLAKKLLEQCGFPIVGIKPNKNNKFATVFLFERTDALLAEMENYVKSKGDN